VEIVNKIPRRELLQRIVLKNDLNMFLEKGALRIEPVCRSGRAERRAIPGCSVREQPKGGQDTCKPGCKRRVLNRE